MFHLLGRTIYLAYASSNNRRAQGRPFGRRREGTGPYNAAKPGLLPLPSPGEEENSPAACGLVEFAEFALVVRLSLTSMEMFPRSLDLQIEGPGGCWLGHLQGHHGARLTDRGGSEASRRPVVYRCTVTVQRRVGPKCAEAGRS